MNNKNIKLAIEYMKNFPAGDKAHDINHLLQVLNYANKITLDEKMNGKIIDEELVALGSLFHDIADYKNDFDKGSIKELAKKRLKNFFEQINYSQEKQDKIIFIIDNISWRKNIDKKVDADFLEFYIVQDADLLTAIGSTGIVRTIVYGTSRNIEIYNKNIKPNLNLTTKEYNDQTKNNEGTTINHFYEKLFKIKDKLNTSTAKLLAIPLHQFMVDFVKQYENEQAFNFN